VVESGGQSGSVGTPETGGAPGSGGQPSTGGETSIGGKAGSGGVIGAGGKTGTGGESLVGGRTGAGGIAMGTGGGPATGGKTGASGAPGTGGKTGAGGTQGNGGSSGMGGSTASGTLPPLKKFFGNIDTNGQIRSDFKSMWDQFSPENAGKWGSVQSSSQTSFNWSSLDAMYKYCGDNNIVFKEHCFFWGGQQPSFASASNIMDAGPNWIKTFCERFPNTAVIDVVNEPLHNVPTKYNSGMGGAGTTGYDWIVQAFKWAKQYCPNAVLVLNDYNTIEYSGENGNIQKLVNAVVKGGGPIGAVGCQGHDVAKVSVSTITSYTNNIITGTGLPIFITEMDIGVADDTSQANTMRDVVTALWKLDQVKGMTYWGYIVGSTWRSNTGLMTSSGTKRPALTWLMSFLGR
jgi:endo-1,4-beta-xylanase